LSQPTCIAFAGTPEFAVPPLRALVAAGYTVPLVLTQPDRPAGRGRKLRASPVKCVAKACGLKLLQPDSFATKLKLDPRPDLLVVAAYGLLLPQWLLDWPRLGCLNVHASLLPRWRGAAPIQRAILAGDAATGISLMRMVLALDAGPVYTRSSVPIGAEETAQELHDRLALLGAEVLISALPSVIAGTLRPVPQDSSRASYAAKITKDEASLDWRRPATELARKVRAFNPWPVAEARLSDGRRLRIWQAAAVNLDGTAAPGTIITRAAASVDVATGRGALRLKTVQPPGSKPMPVAAYMAAHSLEDVSFAT